VQLAHAWGVPALGGGSVSSDAPEIGWQSGAEAGMGAATIPLIGGEVCGYMGLVGSSMILYPEQVILDHEICRNSYDLLHGFDFDAEDMALDIIAQVGPRGHFLKQRHTRQHIRDFRLSPLVGQKGPDGRDRDPREVALDEFKRLDETHHPQPLPGQVLAELDRILAAAEREAERIG
jgi:trimethylamine--corrinoid protein Co-methyltransferase